MAYQIKTHEWDLTEEEQTTAKFIHDYCTDRASERMAQGSALCSQIEANAFEEFKRGFYLGVWRRLDIQVSILWPNESCFGPGCFTFNNDYTKLIGYRVEKVG